MTSSKSHAFRNVPPPPGSKSGTSYTRFIPREELGDFESWKPGSFAGNARAANAAAGGAPASPPAPPPEPSAADWQQRVDAARQAGYQEGYRDGLTALESFKQSFAQQATAQIGALLPRRTEPGRRPPRASESRSQVVEHIIGDVHLEHVNLVLADAGHSRMLEEGP